MTDTQTELTGGCACGAVRYRLASPPMFVHCCHCRDCQRQTGSAFVLNALIETDRIAILSGTAEPGAGGADRQWPAAQDLSLRRLSDRGLERVWRDRRASLCPRRHARRA